jgi:hypothetical protein
MNRVLPLSPAKASILSTSSLGRSTSVRFFSPTLFPERFIRIIIPGISSSWWLENGLKLLEVEGEQAVSVIAGAGLGALADLAAQGYDILRGRRKRIDWSRVGVAAAEGAALGLIGHFVNPTIAKLDKLVTLGVKKTYIEVVIFMSTEVVSSTRNFMFSKVIPAVSDFIKNEVAPPLAFHWIVDKIKR